MLSAKEPGVIRDKVIDIESRDYGISMTPALKAKAVIYLKEWLYSTIESGDLIRYRFNTIYDIPFLKELIYFQEDGNFDRMSAFLVGMFDMKEEYHKEVKTSNSNSGGSNYFNRNLFT